VPLSNFAITWDYRCPFARNAAEHVVTAVQSGAEWDVTYLAFSLDQAHVAEGEPPVWDNASEYPGLLANLAGIVVRDRLPEKFLATHLAFFSVRHDQAKDLRDRAVISEVLTGQGIDPEMVFSAIDEGWPLETARKEHEAAVRDHQVFGVPTFINGDRAVFVRLLDRPQGDAKLATQTIDRVLDLIGDWPELNEFKYTAIPR
jgi:2-hydroxychromene-2-carboxylate isomerase